MSECRRCEITNYAHVPHEWTPITADAENPRVLNIGDPVQCPGVPCWKPGCGTEFTHECLDGNPRTWSSESPIRDAGGDDE